METLHWLKRKKEKEKKKKHKEKEKVVVRLSLIFESLSTLL